jgi:hypothetical protein
MRYLIVIVAAIAAVLMLSACGTTAASVSAGAPAIATGLAGVGAVALKLITDLMASGAITPEEGQRLIGTIGAAGDIAQVLLQSFTALGTAIGNLKQHVDTSGGGVTTGQLVAGSTAAVGGAVAAVRLMRGPSQTGVAAAKRVLDAAIAAGVPKPA